jgi:tRNA G18 (ribose-2'-O)-methylase SpoU
VDPSHAIWIDDAADPRVAELANLKDDQLRRADRAGLRPCFVCEGELVVGRLVASSYRVRSVLISSSRLERSTQLLARLDPGTPVYVAADPVVEAIIGFQFHQGVLASGERVEPPRWQTLADRCSTLVIAENLANQDNVGGLFRDVAVLGGRNCGVLLSPGCCDPLYRKAVRVSMGNALLVPFAWASPWPGVLGELRDKGWEVLAMTPRDGAVDIRTLGGSGKRAILLGAEGPGLTEAALAASDRLVRIPMTPGGDSLNISVAAAVALHRLVDPAGD